MYKEFLLFSDKLRERDIYPDEARKIVAKACDGLAVDPAVFARGLDGKTLQGRYGDDRLGEGFGMPPLIVFDSGKGFIRLYGIGKSGGELLMGQLPLIMTALGRHLGGPYRTEFRDGDCTLTHGGPILYSVRRLVVTKKPEKISHFIGVSAEDRSIEIKKEIRNGLVSMARWLDEDLGGSSMLEDQIPDEDSLFLDILEGQSVPVSIKSGIPAAAFKNLTFCTTLNLNGPWMAGKLRSRGYGIIRRRIER